MTHAAAPVSAPQIEASGLVSPVPPPLGSHAVGLQAHADRPRLFCSISNGQADLDFAKVIRMIIRYPDVYPIAARQVTGCKRVGAVGIPPQSGANSNGRQTRRPNANFGVPQLKWHRPSPTDIPDYPNRQSEITHVNADPTYA
jgi:hypothetical protein